MKQHRRGRGLSAGTCLVVVGALFALSSCSYRAAGVAALGESVRVVVSVNQGRLVRVQGYLQEAVATAIEHRLGWQVSPTGSAKIELHIDEEIISSSGRDARGIASRWTISCRGQSLFTSRQGNANGTWSGTGHSSGLEDEATALQQAAREAGDLITAWLETEAERWPDAAP